MTDKLLKCQMCGREQGVDEARDGEIFDMCGACGARILRYPKDALLARAEHAEAQLAECHRLAALGSREFAEVKAEVENLIADNDRLEARAEHAETDVYCLTYENDAMKSMIERLVEAGDWAQSLLGDGNLRMAGEWHEGQMSQKKEWNTLVDECRGEK